jgi:Antirestriction protein
MATDDTVSPHFPEPRTPITARPVPDSERLMALPRHFSHRLIIFEDGVYAFMRRFARDYRGGFWQFLELSNGGFYMSPSWEGTFRISVDSNGYDGEMSADAAGITVCLFTYSSLSFEYFGDEVFADHFHRLRDFALEHAEASAIFGAID